MNDWVEKELRFVLPSNEYDHLRSRISDRLSEFELGDCALETTVMYDNPNPDLSFYRPEVDGRLRLRTRRPATGDFPTRPYTGDSVLTWKQRIPEHADALVRAEREIEVPLPGAEADAMRAILSDVLRCPRISSYERRRETLYLRGVEIALDLFPYGHVVEFELKPGADTDLLALAAELGLGRARVSLLSCDDMYRELCARAGRPPRADILFDDADMPCVDEFLDA